MSHSPILEPILNSPGLPRLMDELAEIWNDEQKRRQEFYDWVSEDVKAEFIGGEIVVHSPVRRKHNIVLGFLYRILSIYQDKIGNGFVGYEKIMIHLDRNDYEPDLVYFNSEKTQNFTDDQTLFPAPDLVVEIFSVSTEERDRGIKLKDYALNGIPEYWIIDADIEVVEQYLLEDENYHLHQKLSKKDTLRTSSFDGLEIPVKAIFSANENYNYLQLLLS